MSYVLHLQPHGAASGKFVEFLALFVGELLNDGDQREVFTGEVFLCLVYHHPGAGEGVVFLVLPDVGRLFAVRIVHAVDEPVADGYAPFGRAVIVLLYDRVVNLVVQQQDQLLVLVSADVADDLLDGFLLLGRHPLEGGFLLAVLDYIS